MEKVRIRREKIYNYIVERLGEGISPTVREICEDLKIPSTSTVHSDLHFLVGESRIEMEEGRNRTIRLPGPSVLRVPLVGTVAAGQPILAVENIEQYLPLSLPGNVEKDGLFALRVKGDSMVKAAILEGDIVIVEKVPVADNGEIVVAMIGEEATVKRFYKEDGHYRLQPENDSYEPIYTDEIELLGRVTSVVRFYS
ncbi:MAG: transcriptional repressor LexA [Oscillospiraceae bacterium]